MTAPRDLADSEDASAAERLVAESRIDAIGVGKPLSESARQRVRTVESYLRGEVLPRHIQRLAEIERAVRDHEARLTVAQGQVRCACGDDDDAFAAAWTQRVHDWDFGAVNRLVEDHNAHCPIERDLAMNPRTGDHVLINGHSDRRDPLTAAWALRRFPAR